MSSDEEVTTTRKKRFIVNSDSSDDEVTQHANSVDSTSTIEEVEGNKTKLEKKTLRLKAFESSSESEEESTNNEIISTNITKTSTMDSSENLSLMGKSNTSQKIDDHSPIKNKDPRYKDRDLFECESSEEEEDNSKSLPEQQEKSKKSLNKKSWYQNSDDLFGDESSGEENNQKENEDEQSNDEEENMDENLCTVPLSPLPKKERASKSKAMNEMQEIQKESQRMTREARVMIPYHRPRQRTLAEFIARKKSTPSVPLRTSTDRLVSAWKAIEEREKEAIIFYKSESSSDESDSDETKQKSDQTESQQLNKTTDNNDVNSGDKENCETFINEDKQHTLCQGFNRCVDEREETDVEENIPSKEPIDLKSVDSNETKRNLIDNSLSDIIHSESEEFSLKLSESESNPENKDSVTKRISVTEMNVDDDNVPECNKTNNLANTEDFSLKMSESQSELETSCQQRTPDDVEAKETRMEESNVNEALDISEKANNCKEVDSFEAKNEFSNTSPVDILKKVALVVEEKESNGADFNISQNIKEKGCFETLNANLHESKHNKKYNLPSINNLTGVPKMTVFDAEEIVLDKEVAKPGVDSLIERFFTHLSYKKKPVKKKTSLELSIVSADTDSSGQVNGINQEVVKVMVGEAEEEENPSLAKPGAKLARLRAHLQAEMERQREQEWTKKQQEQRLYEEEIYEGEKDVCDADEEAGDDDEDEVENGEESDENKSDSEEEEVEEEESEEEEEREEKKLKNKSAFIDDEAEESDDDNCIGKEETSSDSFVKRPAKKKLVFQRTNTGDMFLSQEGLKSSTTPEDEELPSFQKQEITEGKLEEPEENDSPVCPSPAFQLTGLEGKDITHDWSRQSTPCKDVLSPKMITPVRSKPFSCLIDKSPLVGSQDLENLCSGTFVSQPIDDKEEENNTEDFQLFLADDSQISEDEGTPLKSLAKKSTSDGKRHVKSLLIDDDDDDISTSITSKKTKKLNFSDDESGNEESNQPKDESEESDEEEIADQNGEVDYDSEENEVVKTAGDFLDKEAELSESEWGSEDEDEQGLDILDMEEADKEKIDQRRLKQQLDQMHMKQMLIEDKREVRLLQEMLLEDGELHSENRRQRLFRWSNNTTFGEDNKASLDSDEDKAEEDEDEENWRKARHEREQYLAEHSKKSEHMELVADEHFDSKVLQMGQKTLQRLKKSSQTPPLLKPSESIPSPDPKKPYSLLMNSKRGSFLSRGQQVLSRLAQIVSNSDGPINQPKNSRNFVFASISPTKNEVKEEIKPLQSNKRKIPVLPLPVAKKPCVNKPKTANKKSLFEALAKVKS